MIAFLTAIVTGSYAQSVATYSFAAGTSGVLDPMAGSTQLVASGSDDTVSAVTNIGFTFNYGGTDYTQFSVSANGLIRLGSVAAVASGTSNYTNSAANANANAPVIMPYWDDLATGSAAGGGKVHSILTGTAPNQKLIIEWFVTVPRGTATAANAKFQCILEETTNTITFVYGSGMVVNTANAGASIGLCTATAVYNTVTVASNTNTTSTFVTANTAAIPAGTTYTFSSPVPCTGTPSAGTVAPANLALCNGSLPGNIVASGFSTGVSGLNFQWEESTDNFVTPVDAVGGSGATTAIYTPPAHNGTPKQYRLKITCSNSGLIGYSSVCTIVNPSNPAVQATTLASGTVTLTTIPLSWVAGNGGRRVVYFSNSAVTDPVNGNGPALTAAAAYAGSGQQIVYDGTGTGVTVTGLTPGTTYYVKVYEYLRCGSGPYDFYYNVSTGTNALTVASAAPPANDNFASASAIACGNIYTGDTTNASLDEDNAPDGFGADMDARNVWYSFTGTGAPQTVTLNLCGSAYDSSVLIYTGTSGNLTLVAGNDDDATCGAAPLNTRSRVSFNSNGTTTYYIAIEGYNASSYGVYNMDVTCAAINPPAVPNQTCATALAVNVDGTDTLSDNSYGTINPVQPSCDTFGSIQDVWFSFVAPSSGAVNCLVTNGTMTSSNFAVYSGTCAGLTEVGGTCNSNLTVPTTEALSGLTVGNTYYVQVWSNAAEQGTFTLRLTDTALNNESFDTTGFMVYPNPVKDVLNLSYTKDISNVSVHNLLGQTVISKNTIGTQSKIDMSGLASGTYLVKVTVDNLVKTIKIVKE